MQFKSPEGASVASCSRPTAGLNHLIEPAEDKQNVTTTHLAYLPKGMVDIIDIKQHVPM